MENAPTENTIEVHLDAAGELTVHRFSRWTDKDGRLLVIYGFWYGRIDTKPMAGDFQKTDIEILDVHAQNLNTIPYGRFLHYIINGKLFPWKDPPIEAKPIY